MAEYSGLIGFLIGVVSRVFIPWLMVRQQNPETAKWDWSKVWPQLLSVVIILALVPLFVGDVEEMLALAWQPAWLAGWGGADIGRKIAKRFQAEAK